MPRLSAIDAINPAFERMRTMLFPFRFKTWLKIGFIGWLAGAAGTGSFNFNVPSSSGHGGGGSASTGQDVEQAIRVFVSEHLFLIALIVAMSILIGLGLFYLSCRFRFILFDSVLQRDPQIGRGWHRYEPQAHRYFGFLICYGVVSALVLATILGLPMWRAYRSGIFKSDNPFPALFAYLIPMLLGVFLFVIVVAIITSLVNDFVVPVLALDEATIGDAWSRLKGMIAAEPGAFAGYLGMKLVLSIAAGIVVAIAMLVILIPAVIVAIFAVLIVKALADTVLGMVLVVLGGLVALALLILLSLLTAAPVVVFFTSYAFYFLGGRYPRLGSLLWPQPPTPVAPPPSVPPPPPFPGAAPAM